MSEMQSEENVSNTQELPAENKDEAEIESDGINQSVERAVKQVIQQYEFSGPIPPPQIIKGYEQACPGSADRIIAMAEKQSDHRQKMEEIKYKAESRDSLLGIMSGFILGIGCIIAAIVMAIAYPQLGGVISGTVLGSAGVGAIALTAIKSTRKNNNE